MSIGINLTDHAEFELQGCILKIKKFKEAINAAVQVLDIVGDHYPEIEIDGVMINSCMLKNYFEKSPELQSSVQDVKKYHNQILSDLFEHYS